ncbi:MAG: hypothetical protein IPI67_13475 [Myxococcales bacterium]|nr:hypothetical protein [Myxococcales bacterium]
MRPPVVVLLLAVLGPLSCGGSSEGGSGGSASGGAAGSGGGAAGLDAGGSGGTGGIGGAAGGDAALGGSTSGGGGGIDFDGAVLEGSLEASTCQLPTADSDCDTFPQCGCEPGQKCDVIDLVTGRVTCSVAGSSKPHQGCSALGAQCAAGSSCLGGACKELCETTANCVGANRECRQVESFSSGTAVKVPALFACTSGCDPVNPGLVCGTGISCQFVGKSTDCYASGGGTGPGACTQTTGLACAPGYTCINTTQQTGKYSCLKWCRLTASDCPSGFVCKDLSSKPSLGTVEYGACFAN